MAPLLTRLGSGRGGFGFGRRATLYWTVNGVSGTVNASDFNEGVSGSFVITANAGSVVLNVSNDATTEGSEYERQIIFGDFI